MAIPREFNEIIRKQLNVHAAWLPITNNFELGDYGIITDGVFTKMGNIKKEFNIPFNEVEGPEAALDFSSQGTTVVKFEGGAEVPAFSVADIEAKLIFKFDKEKSFMLKAPVIKVRQIENIHELAKKLHETTGWEKRWKVVYQLYSAQDPLIISTIAPHTEITISGKASALKSLNAGDASLNIGVNKEVGLKINGKSGIIGLGLFRLRLIGKSMVIRELAPQENYEIVTPSTVEMNDLEKIEEY